MLKEMHLTKAAVVVLLLSFFYAENLISQTQHPSDYMLTVTATLTPPRDLDLLPTLETLMLADKENCQLPCWWNFQPGETTLKEIAAFLQSIDFERHWEQSIYSSLSLENFISAESLAFFFQDSTSLGTNFLYNFGISFTPDENGILRFTTVRFYNPIGWLISEADRISFLSLLDQIEETPDVYLFENIEILTPATEDITARITESVNPRVNEQSMIVVFPNQGVRASYIFQLEYDLNENGFMNVQTLRLCPDFEHTLSVEMRLGEVSDEPPDNQYYVTPEEFYDIGISTEEFVEFFRENPNDCLYLFANAE
jgi:hypothetical protein